MIMLHREPSTVPIIKLDLLSDFKLHAEKETDQVVQFRTYYKMDGRHKSTAAKHFLKQ